MHRLITNPSVDQEVDHINRNTLDNRKQNLRIVNHSQNQQNRKLNMNNTSGYKGVSWHKELRKWRANINVNGKRLFLGFFQNTTDAAREYNQAALKYYGEYANINKI